MEGCYISPDVCFQVVQAYAYDADGNPNKWHVYGMKDVSESFIDWTGIAVKQEDDVLVTFDDYNVFEIHDEGTDEDDTLPENTCRVKVKDGILIWPGDTVWRKVVFSSRQLYLMRRNRPMFLTPILCSLIFTFTKYLMVQCNTTWCNMKKKIMKRNI